MRLTTNVSAEARQWGSPGDWARQISFIGGPKWGRSKITCSRHFGCPNSIVVITNGLLGWAGPWCVVNIDCPILGSVLTCPLKFCQLLISLSKPPVHSIRAWHHSLPAFIVPYRWSTWILLPAIPVVLPLVPLLPPGVDPSLGKSLTPWAAMCVRSTQISPCHVSLVLPWEPVSPHCLLPPDTVAPSLPLWSSPFCHVIDGEAWALSGHCSSLGHRMSGLPQRHEWS